MHRLQNVWEQLVIIGVLKKSLQTWHRRADSRGARAASGVGSQSVLSETEAESKDGMTFNANRRGRAGRPTISTRVHAAVVGWCVGGLCKLGFEGRPAAIWTKR